MIDKKYTLIQVLRAFAAIFVMLYHATRHYNIKGFSFLSNFFTTGFLGVDIFFVLSGFVIYFSSHSYFKNKDYGSFITKRMIRIFPSFWLFLLLPLTLVFFFFPKYISLETAFEPLHYLKIFFLLFDHLTISQVTWTLSFELYFYLLFLLLIIHKNFKYLIFVILVFSLFNFLGILNFENFYLKKYLFSPLLLEFFLGVLIAYLIPKINSPKPYLLTCCFLLSVVLFYCSSYLEINQYIHLSKHNRVLYFGIPSFFLIFSLLLFEKFNRVYINKKLMLIGDSSYVLYLIHSIILSFANKLILENKFVVLNKSFSTILVCFIIIAMSVFLHTFIEKPMMLKLSLFFKKKNK